MKSRVFLPTALLWAFVAVFASAQYTATSGGASFTSIAALPGAMALGTVSACDDCVEMVNLSFTFPWFGGLLNVTQIGVASNGSILVDGSTGSLCCTPHPLNTLTTSRISLAQEDLNPSAAGTIYALDTGTSIIISYEGVEFFAAAGSFANVQAELFANGDIDIRFAAMSTASNNIATGLSEYNGGSYLWVSPDAVLPEFNNLGVTTGGVVPQNTGVLFTLAGPTFQLNSAEASLDLDGVQASGIFGPGAVTTVCPGQAATLTAASTLAGNPFDMGINFASLVPASLTTPNGQIVNLAITPSLFFLNSGTVAPNLIPFFPFSAPVSAPAPVVVSAQLLIVDPGHPDGIRLSQGVELDVQAAGVGGPQPGPTADDGTLQVTFAPPNCGPTSVPFCGTAFTSLFISANGRLTFGAADGAFSPTVATAMTGAPSFGHWTDFNVSAAGTIDYTLTFTTITVNFNGVPHYEETTANNLVLSIDASGTCTIDVSGIQANPLTGINFITGDAVWMGLSGGNLIGATDGGPTAFTSGGAGVNALATDMIYDFVDQPTIGTTGGFLPSVPSLQTGSGTLTFVPGGTPGAYAWSGL
jgi:hypothetical protein